MDKELEDLKQRIEAIERKLNNKSLNFGRSYSLIGSSDSDFIIKTRGLVKILYGNKFIDLIKDGKINSSSKFIYLVDSSDNIGPHNGIYLTKDNLLFLYINSAIIPLTTETGTTYVSFMDLLVTTSELKYTALKNIGFIYDSIEDFSNNALLNGVVYIQSENKLYLIKDGLLTEFSIEIPNPYTKLFVIAKQDDLVGALVILGLGIENSLAFNSLYIYEDSINSIISSLKPISIEVEDIETISISNGYTQFLNTIICLNILSSLTANKDSGFRLYIDADGLSVLEIDKIILRQETDEEKVDQYNISWFSDNNIISSVSIGDTEEDITEFGLLLEYLLNYEIGDILAIFVKNVVNDEENEISYSYYDIVYLKIISIENLSIDVTTDYLFSSSLLESLKLKPIYKIKLNDDKYIPLRLKDNNLDIVQYKEENEELIEEVLGRLGNITDLLLKGKENNEEIDLDFTGIYSKDSTFLKAQYTSEYDLPVENNSTKFVSTEWFHKWFPKGTIIMFNGLSEIPEGWAICDGTNGTPNLINKFIVGGTSLLESTDDNSMDYPFEINSSNIPVGEHTHNYDYPESISITSATSGDTISVAGPSSSSDKTSGPNQNSKVLTLKPPRFYSLIFIMKIYPDN